MLARDIFLQLLIYKFFVQYIKQFDDGTPQEEILYEFALSYDNRRYTIRSQIASMPIFIGYEFHLEICGPIDKALNGSSYDAKVAERPRNCLQSNTTPVQIRTLAFSRFSPKVYKNFYIIDLNLHKAISSDGTRRIKPINQ